MANSIKCNILHLVYILIYTKSANLWELFQKMVLRWYLTPYRLSKFALGVSPLCWIQCGEVGTLFHLLWSCPNITQYWKQIYNLILQVLKNNLEPSPGMAILSLEMDLAPHHMRTLLSHILLAARLSLVRHWKDIKIPEISKVTQTINTHSTYEQLFASEMGKYSLTNKIWEPWNKWYNIKVDSGLTSSL